MIGTSYELKFLELNGKCVLAVSSPVKFSCLMKD